MLQVFVKGTPIQYNARKVLFGHGVNTLCTNRCSEPEYVENVNLGKCFQEGCISPGLVIQRNIKENLKS